MWTDCQRPEGYVLGAAESGERSRPPWPTDEKLEAEGQMDQGKADLKQRGEQLKDAGKDIKDAFKG